MRYHHLGVPVTAPRPGMEHLPALGVWCSDHQDNPFGIQWMHYEEGCPLPEIVRRMPHLAFEVDDLDEALKNRTLLIAPNSPSPGVRVAFVEHDGCPVELLQFDRADDPRRAR